MKVLFLVPYPTEGPSNRFRVEQYLPYLNAKGIQYTLRPFIPSQFYKILYKKRNYFRKIGYFLYSTIRRFSDILRIIKYDIIFVHIEAFPFGPPILEWLFYKMGKPIIFDFEDAIYLAKGNSILSRLKAPNKFYSILRFSKHIIVCNNYLKDKLKEINPNIIVIPTSIDTDKFKIKENKGQNNKIIIGWIGSHSTFSCLEMIFPILEKLAKKYKFILKIVGAKRNIVLSGIEVINEDWILEREVESVQNLDIGIYPLPADEWSMAKTPFKTIQYMSVGIPVIASNVGGNREIIQDGINGFLASSEDEWVGKLSRLIEDADLRRKFGRLGRKTVEEKYSLEVSAPRFLKILEEVYNAISTK